MPTYKRISSFKIALECIRAQTYKNLEIIISNDDFSDIEIDKYIVELMLFDKRIVYFKQAVNLGVIANQIFVLNKATGKFFMWMSDDDLRNNRFIEKLVYQLEADNSLGFVFCDFQEVFTSGEHNPKYIKSHFKKLTSINSKVFLLQACKYFFQSSRFGSRNLFYSIFYTNLLKDIDFRKLTNGFQTFHMDSLIVYHLVQRTYFYIVEEKMCMLTTENTKLYDNKVLKSNLFNKLVKFIMDRLYEYYLYYINSSLILKVFIFLLFIPKFLIDFVDLLYLKLKGKL